MTDIGIVAFAFGMPRNLPSNRKIAILARAQMRNRGAIVYTQQVVPLNADQHTTIPEELAGTPSTLHIAQGAATWARELGLVEVIIICAGPHAWRCRRDMKEALNHEKINATILVNPSGGPSPCFYKESEQWWTRTAWQWNVREIFLRCLPFWLYAKITG